MIVEMAYNSEESAEIAAFELLTDIEKTGYWEKTHDGPLSGLKARIKDHYLVAQNYTCPYCRQKIVVKNNASWDAEHIIPKDIYPSFMFEAQNLCIACKDCNMAKSNKNVLVNKDRKTFPAKNTDYLISHPHFDDYETNIKIISVAGFYFPKNEKGRQTVEICGLLRFLFKLANYECGTKDIDDQIDKLSTALMETKDGNVRHLLLSLLAKIASEGASLQEEQARNFFFNSSDPHQS